MYIYKDIDRIMGKKVNCKMIGGKRLKENIESKKEKTTPGMEVVANSSVESRPLPREPYMVGKRRK